ncbi:MAG: putative cytidylate kinase [Acidobacteria bacterium]|nr:putative cytidylate kinase [Acidobacteriota bacterium]
MTFDNADKIGQLTTITIARQVGCGGAYVGQVIAKRLGLKYVDREVLYLAAQSLGVDAAAVEASNEKLTSFWEKLFGGVTFLSPDAPYTPPPVRRFSDEELFERQVEALKLIAAREDCVIVGYGGAFVLPHHGRTVNLYFHAPLKFRMRRLIEIYKLPGAHEARQMIGESDELRKRYFERMTDLDWTCADNYHLCIDTSIYPLPELADRLVRFIEHKLQGKQGAGPPATSQDPDSTENPVG